MIRMRELEVWVGWRVVASWLLIATRFEVKKEKQHEFFKKASTYWWSRVFYLSLILKPVDRFSEWCPACATEVKAAPDDKRKRLINWGRRHDAIYTFNVVQILHKYMSWILSPLLSYFQPNQSSIKKNTI